MKQRLPLATYILIAMVCTVVTAIMTIAGILYFNFSGRLTTEFQERVAAESGELGLILNGQINQVQNRLREMAQDNSVRVTLMLGADQQLREHLQKIYSLQPGVHFYIHSSSSGNVFSTSDTLPPDAILKALIYDTPHPNRLYRDARLGVCYAGVLPIHRKDERIGTAACIYLFQEDDDLRHILGDRLVFRQDGTFYDLFSGDGLPAKFVEDGIISAVRPASQRLIRPEGSSGERCCLADIMHIAPLDTLETGKRQVLLLLLFSVCGVLVLTISISYFLSRKISAPLQRLSDMAMAVADGRCATLQNDHRATIVEVERLRETLDIMLAHLHEADQLRRYQELFDGVADPVFIHDAQGRFLEVNGIALQQLGYTRAVFLGLTTKDIMPDWGDADHALALTRQLVTEGRHEFETVLLARNGERLVVECHARRIEFKRQQVILSVIRDITDRKQAKEALRKSEQRLAVALDVSLAGAWELDLKTGGLMVDPKLFERFGYGPEELPATPGDLEALIDERMREKVREMFAAFLDGRIQDYGDEFRIRTAGGELRWVHQKARLIAEHPGEAPDTVIGALMDITQRKQAELALKESEARYRTILDSTDIGYFEVDLKGRLTYANQAFCEILGYSMAELDGMSYRRFTDEETVARVFQVYQEVFQSGVPNKMLDYPYRDKHGEQRIIETSVFLIRDFEQTPVGFRGLARDVTEQKNLERRLRQAQKMEALGTLAGGVAHDLNNILSGIVSYPELLLMDLEEESPLYKPIQTIKTSGEKAATIVQDLLTLARRGVAVKEITNLNRIVADYLESPEFRKMKTFHPDVTIDVDLSPDLFNVSGSPVHLSKTVMNLVSNGAEAMPDGGRLRVETFNRYVDRPFGDYERVEEGDYAVLRVRDTGIGMKPEEMNKIFEPFYSKKVMGRSGTGLGMAVVWGTVKDHAGYIDLTSREHCGSTFTLYFPADKQSPDTMPQRLSLDHLRSEGETVMIVDDVAEQREIASTMLMKLGYQVEMASSGEEALSILGRRPVDIVLLDMIMAPGMDGLDTYREMVKLKPKQKAVIASGFSETDRVREAQRLGAGEYVKKPYSLNQIGQALKKSLHKDFGNPVS